MKQFGVVRIVNLNCQLLVLLCGALIATNKSTFSLSFVPSSVAIMCKRRVLP